MKTTIFLLLPVVILSSCKRTVQPEKGSIDVVSNVYFNASKGLDNVQHFLVSKLNYSNDTIVEFVPDPQEATFIDQVNFITDSTYRPMGDLQKALGTGFITLKNIRKIPLTKKKTGAIFTKKWLPNYAYRQDISDTVLFGKTYKRFQIVSKENFTRYYVYPTDTILPYKIYPEVREHYKGRIERIDSYNRKSDIFVTLQLLPKNTWDEEAKEIFSYNSFLKKQTK